MSGVYNGTQQKLSETCDKKILYVLCQAHKINVFVETACNASSIMKEFVDTLQALYVFFSSSTKRFQRLIQVLEIIECSLRSKMYNNPDGHVARKQ